MKETVPVLPVGAVDRSQPRKPSSGRCSACSRDLLFSASQLPHSIHLCWNWGGWCPGCKGLMTSSGKELSSKVKGMDQMISGAPQIFPIKRHYNGWCLEVLRSITECLCARHCGYSNGLRLSATDNQKTGPNVRNRHLTIDSTQDSHPWLPQLLPGDIPWLRRGNPSRPQWSC